MSIDKIQVLFLASNPEQTEQLKLDEEIRAITEKIRASEFRDRLELTSLWAVRPDDLLQAFLLHKPTIVHFSGHGNPTGEIVLTNDKREPVLINSTALKMLFTVFKDNIRVVLLNACYSKIQASAIVEVIDCVIGMNAPVTDDACVLFAASFYRALGFGRSIQEAFDLGKTAVALSGILDIETPELLTKQGVEPSLIYLVDNMSSSAVLVPENRKHGERKTTNTSMSIIAVGPDTKIKNAFQSDETGSAIISLKVEQGGKVSNTEQHARK